MAELELEQLLEKKARLKSAIDEAEMMFHNETHYANDPISNCGSVRGVLAQIRKDYRSIIHRIHQMRIEIETEIV